jgi:uncharacterized coiled-coil protein SlyX
VAGRFWSENGGEVDAIPGQTVVPLHPEKPDPHMAEEVEKVNPDLIVRDKEGKPYSVRYDQVNAMLLNEFLKEHRKVQEQEATISQLKSTVAKQDATIAQQQKGMEAVTARLNEQAAQIQKVSAQLESSKPAPQVVNNP